jgi:3',5'-cyclic AMP phosphodiesterase CpdA
MKRRNFLAATLTGLLGANVLPLHAVEKKSNKHSLRFVHLTDMHIHSGPVPERGIQNLLEEIHTLDEKPDFVINTGDNIMDSLKRSKEETTEQWDSWREYYRSKLKYDLFSCIGNHDIWGWSLKNAEIETDPLFGKNWAVKELDIPHRYYSLDKKGWHFIFLDSSFRDTENHSYTAKLDKEQFEWLENDLKNTPAKTPICVVSHIPIISTSVFFDGDNEKSGGWNVPGAWMHIDARKIKDLFSSYPNIKLAFSGHVHLAEKTSYLGIDYHCNGAACGAWWFGKYQEFPPMYAVIDLNEDGTFHSELVHYNWKRRSINIDPAENNEPLAKSTNSLF